MGNVLCCCCHVDDLAGASKKSDSRPNSIETREVTNHGTTYNNLTVESNSTTNSVIVEERTPAKPAQSPPVTPSLPPLHPPSETNKSVYTPIDRSSGPPSVSSDSPYRPSTDSSGKKLTRRISSGLSSRGSFSSSTAKEHREFRVFLPVLCKSDEEWLTTEQITAYNDALEALKKEFRNPNADDAEESTIVEDTFVVGKGYFGLRYLDDKKLEMRVKTENTPIWMEKWSKVRFGKKAISHYRADIISYLHDVGHKDPSIEKIIDEPQLVTFSKRLLNAPDAHVELGAITSPTSKRQEWLTVYYGGDSNKIEEFAFNHTVLFAAVDQCCRICELHSDSAFSACFSPVISGYPLWLRVVTSQYTSLEVLKEEVIPAVEVFVQFAKTEEEGDVVEEEVHEVKDVSVNLFEKKSQ